MGQRGGRWGRRITLVVAVLALAALVAWAMRPRGLPVDVGTASVGPFEQVIREDGRWQVRHRYLVTAPLAADLSRIDARVGDPVAAGQVIARLSPVRSSLIDERSRGVLAEREGAAEANRLVALAEVERVGAALKQARLDAERTDKLADERFVAAAARDKARLAVSEQTMALEAARERVHLADHALAESRAARRRALGGRSEGATESPAVWAMKSPVAGRILKIHQPSGGPLTIGQPILEIGDVRQLEAVVDVLSGDAQRLVVGAPARLSLGAGQPELPGRVDRIEPVAFTKVSSLGIEEQRVNVVIVADPLPEGLTPPGDGYRVEASVRVRHEAAVLRVPTAALLRDGARWAVLRLDGDRVRRATVTVRDRNAELAWVQDGVSAGDRVVLYPGAPLADGDRVSVNRSSEPTSGAR